MTPVSAAVVVQFVWTFSQLEVESRGAKRPRCEHDHNWAEISGYIHKVQGKMFAKGMQDKITIRIQMDMTKSGPICSPSGWKTSSYGMFAGCISICLHVFQLDFPSFNMPHFRIEICCAWAFGIILARVHSLTLLYTWCLCVCILCFLCMSSWFCSFLAYVLGRTCSVLGQMWFACSEKTSAEIGALQFRELLLFLLSFSELVHADECRCKTLEIKWTINSYEARGQATIANWFNKRIHGS